MPKATWNGVVVAESGETQMVEGKTIEESRAISQADIIAALDGVPHSKRFCANLAIEALRDGIRKLGEDRPSEIETGDSNDANEG